jgi:hypothetical protein
MSYNHFSFNILSQFIYFFVPRKTKYDINFGWNVVGTCSVAYMENLYLMFGFEGAL